MAKQTLSRPQFGPEAIRPGEPPNRLSRGAAYTLAYSHKNQQRLDSVSKPWTEGGRYTYRDKIGELAAELHND